MDPVFVNLPVNNFEKLQIQFQSFRTFFSP